MTPWRDDPEEPQLAKLLDAARAVPEPPAEADRIAFGRLQHALDARSRRPRAWQLAIPALAAFALTVLVVPRLLPHPADPRPSTLAGSPAAPPHPAPPADAVRTLTSGSVEAAAGARIRTPSVVVWVEAGHCRVQVAGDQTELEVFDGSVHVYRTGVAEEVLSSGTRVHFGSAPSLAAPDACAPVPQPDARRSCYAQVALGSGLAAQNALFALGQLDHTAHRLDSAVQYFHAYVQRYPDGALWPEAAAGMLTARLEQHAWPQALQAAELYLARAPRGARGPEVRLIRANLLREHTGQLREALQAYQALAEDDVPAAVRSEALFGTALAANHLGRFDAARDALQAYAREFPQGAHAAEVARMQRR
jgi:tetratricopeptide (TPR) repeat protein